MAKQMKEEVLLSTREQKRIAAAPNAKVAEALAITDNVKRGEALWKLGACTYSYGSCRLGKGGTVAMCDKKENGEFKVECAGHIAKQVQWAKDHAPKAKVTEMKPKAAKAKVAVQERHAAGPPEPKENKRARASHDVGSVTAYMKSHPGTSYTKAKAAVAAQA
jgi:hypothetical protein